MRYALGVALLAMATGLTPTGAAAQDRPAPAAMPEAASRATGDAVGLGSLHPAAEVKRALSRGDLRLLAVCGYVCLPPGVALDGDAGSKPLPARILPGTSDAPVSAEFARLNEASYRYAVLYNQALVKALGGKPRPGKLVHG